MIFDVSYFYSSVSALMSVIAFLAPIIIFIGTAPFQLPPTQRHAGKSGEQDRHRDISVCKKSSVPQS